MFIFAMLLAITAAAVTGYKCPGGQLTPEQRKAIVCQHNKLRSLLIHGKLKNNDGYNMPHGKNMLQMKWSCELEKSAQNWANNCQFKHSPKKEGIGENVYYESSSMGVAEAAKVAGTSAGQSWWEELEKYYTNNPPNKLAGVSGSALHYTQMAWGKTYEIGCGIAPNCDGGKKVIVVCQYSPGGNMNNELIYELGKPCGNDSDCSTGRCSKKSGLCMKCPKKD